MCTSPKPAQEPFFLTHYCGIVCTPTGIISTAGLITTGRVKETQGPQENPPAHSRGDTEQHVCDSLFLLLFQAISNQLHFIEIPTKLDNYHKTKQMTKWDHCQDRCGSSLTGTLGLAFCSPAQQARPLAHTQSALLALSCPLSRPRRPPADQEAAAARQTGSASFLLCSGKGQWTLSERQAPKSSVSMLRVATSLTCPLPRWGLKLSKSYEIHQTHAFNLLRAGGVFFPSSPSERS